MNENDLVRLSAEYERDGFISGIDVLTPEQAAAHRRAMENAETRIGPLHYRTKVHTILLSPLQLATAPVVLDLVQRLIGPDILVYNVTYIVKKAHSTSHVSWHQDLTYWGLSDDQQVSMWLALSPATEVSGCMRMVPGSQLRGRREHKLMQDDSNVLFQGQKVTDVVEDDAVMCPLRPGQASFHHGWTLHSSMPNRSDDRRIGLNVQYLATSVEQLKNEHDTAMLVRGTDVYHHFGQDLPAETDLAPDVLARQRELERRHVEIAGQV